MRAFHFYLQLICFLLVVTSLVAGFFEDDYFFFIVLIQTLLGGYQLFTGFILLLTNERKYGKMGGYLTSAILFLIVIIGLSSLKFNGDEWLMFVLLYFVPWIWALWFFHYSYQLYRGSLP